MDSNGSPVSPRRSSCAKTSPIRAFAPRPPPSVPVLVDERADAGLYARDVRELDDVLDVPYRAEDEDILGPLQPGLFRNLGAPSRDPASDGRLTRRTRSTPAQFRPCASTKVSAMGWNRSAFVLILRSGMKACWRSP